MRALAVTVFVLASGCAGQDPLDLLANTIDGVARSACRAAGNCEVRCAGGGTVEHARVICLDDR